MENTVVGLGFRVRVERKMETVTVGLRFRVRMDKKMETAIIGYIRNYYKDPFLHS